LLGRRAIKTPHLLIFTLDQQRYALSLESVAKVVRAAAITPLPQAPEIVLGVLDLQGEVIPVINLRKRFRLPERRLRHDDHFLIARSSTRTLALVVDLAEEVREERELAVKAPEEVVAGLELVQGVASTEDGIVLIHDLERLLFPAEEELLSRALGEVS